MKKHKILAFLTANHLAQSLTSEGLHSCCNRESFLDSVEHSLASFFLCVCETEKHKLLAMLINI